MRALLNLSLSFVLIACPVSTPGNGGSNSDAGDASPDGGACQAWDEAEMPAVAETMGVYDELRRRIVFFGGDDVLPVECRNAGHAVGRFEVYNYDTVCARFREEQLPEGPRGRARGMAVYDPDGDQMLVFGGRSRGRDQGNYRNYNDVWALNLESMQWAELEAVNAPPLARSNPAGGFNRRSGELVVFGGNSSVSGLSFSPHNDVWAFHPETLTWRRLEAQGDTPSARLFHSAAVDDTHNRLFVFGGGDAGAWQGPFLGDLWMFDLEAGTWELLAAESNDGPDGRIWSTITYDATSDRVLLFGGHDDGSVGNNNDTWSFDLEDRTWTALIEPETVNEPSLAFCNFPVNFTNPNSDAPDRRSAHLAALDTQRGEWMIFGGKTDCGIINDVWLFDLNRDAWINLLPATVGEACNRGDNPGACVSMCR
jgi:hypothetical protein